MAVDIATLSALSGQPEEAFALLDTARGLASSGGDPQLYVDLLSSFITTHAADVSAIDQHLQSKGLAALGKLAHSIRGTSSLLGIDTVASHASHLEQAIKSQAPPEQIGAAATLLRNGLSAHLRTWTTAS